MSDSVPTGHTQLDSLEGVFCLTILESIASDRYNNLAGEYTWFTQTVFPVFVLVFVFVFSYNTEQDHLPSSHRHGLLPEWQMTGQQISRIRLVSWHHFRFKWPQQIRSIFAQPSRWLAHCMKVYIYIATFGQGVLNKLWTYINVTKCISKVSLSVFCKDT